MKYELSELLTYQLISRALITATSIYNVIYINIIQTVRYRSFDQNVLLLDTFNVKHNGFNIIKQIYLYLHYILKNDYDLLCIVYKNMEFLLLKAIFFTKFVQNFLNIQSPLLISQVWVVYHLYTSPG